MSCTLTWRLKRGNMETKYPVLSEIVEPAMAHIVGRLWKQVEEAEDKDKEDACFYLWAAIKGMNRVAWACNMKRPGAVHFSIAMGNIQGYVADYIKNQLGFNPWHDKDHPTAKLWKETVG